MKTVLVICCSLIALSCSRSSSGSAQPQGGDSARIAEGTSVAQASQPITYAQRQGKYIYGRYCAVCHGDQGAGDGFNAYNLDPKPHSLADSTYVAALSDEALSQVIALGGRGVNKSVLMPAYDGTLNQDQISYLVAYIRRLAGNHERTP
jgi:mono/diheme cytochrome c family protein